MGKLAEAYVDVSARLGKLDSGLADARGRLTRFVGAGNSALSGLGAGLALGGLGAALFDAAKSAADMGETVSKVKAVFGQAAGAIAAQADDLAEKFGLVKSVSMDAAANIGLVAQAAGLTKDASAGLSNRLVKLAADASSFFNIGFEESLEKIRSALVGESEPIRSFGVLLSEAAVQQEALALGLVKTTKEITEQTKVAARASIIFKQMATVSGDLERTQDSASNQMKKLAGDIENLKAKLGESLIDPLQQSVKLARELGDALGKAIGGESAGALGKELNANLIAYRALLDGAEGGRKEGAATGLPGGGALGWLGGLFQAGLGPDPARMNELAGVGDFNVNNEALALRQKTDARRRAEMVDATAGIFDRWADPDAKPGNAPGVELTGVQKADAMFEAVGKALGNALAGGAGGKLTSALAANFSALPDGSAFDAVKLARATATAGLLGGGTGLGNPLGTFGALLNEETARAKAEGQAEADADAADALEKRRSGWGGITTGDDFWKQTQQRLLEDDVPKKQLDEAKEQTRILGGAFDSLKDLVALGKKPAVARAVGPED